MIWLQKWSEKYFFFSLFYSLSCKKILMIFKKKKIQQMLSYIFRWDLKKLSTLIFQSNSISKKQLWIGVWWCQFNPTTNLGSFLLGHQKCCCWFLSIWKKRSAYISFSCTSFLIRIKFLAASNTFSFTRSTDSVVCCYLVCPTELRLRVIVIRG